MTYLRYFSQMNGWMLKPRGTGFLLAVALAVSGLYVATAFDTQFLLGRGPFWDYPVGPWLQDAGDTRDNVDVLDYLVAYTGFVQSKWSLPLFQVAAIAAPAGTSVVFLDFIPIAALLGRISSSLTGMFILPYGAWTGFCFVLSAAFATLMLAENGQRSILAAGAASILAVSAPALLHRFGHFPLLAHFLILGAFFLYMRERSARPQWLLFICWSAWLSLALLTNPYMFGMVSAIYAASLVRYWRLNGIRSRGIEPVLSCCIVILVMFELGFIGSGASLSGGQFGYFSMNLLSPFMPQRSGIFSSMTTITDATGGQYEGFSYLGLGGLVLVITSCLINPVGIFRSCSANRELALVLLLLTLFALSSNIWFGEHELIKINIGWKLRHLAGIFRSSGRMFWPAYYILLLGSLMFVLRIIGRSWRLPLISACCLLQLLDSEPLRARMESLSDHGGKPLLDQAEWSKRIAESDFVRISPPYSCSDEREQIVDMELQLMAIRGGRKFNVVYNPRLQTNCAEELRRVAEGPWSPTTLYVFLDSRSDAENAWTPAQLSCTKFSDGKWCLGAVNKAF